MTNQPDRPETRRVAPEKKPDDKPISFWQLVGSTLYAAIGVQNKANRERDFSRGRPLPFIVAGVIFTVVFVLTIVIVVRVVLSGTGN